jgi:hypothetical protein
MCSIEEAWAGQTFDNYKVQSQADLRRKYMSISDDMFTRNNEFTIANKEQVSRMGNQGINTKMIRPLQVAPSQLLTSSSSNFNPNSASAGTSASDNSLNVSFADNQASMDNYGGLEPRPGYMSIYNNDGQGLPMPTQTQAQSGRSSFSDINQAFQVSPVVERFMARGGNSNNNSLLNENSNDDRLVITKKFISADNNKNNTIDNQTIQGLSQVRDSLQDILTRLERVEFELHNGGNRNMCDMVLYVLVGMLIAFILYSLLRK